MKRSEINTFLEEAQAFITARLPLPPFADWTPQDWQARASEVRPLVETGLGWDLTDFGLGDFERVGLTLFTLRNGTPDGAWGTPYAEKLLVVGAGQVTPWHFHWRKTEDIIHRGGGPLELRLAGATPEGELADSPVSVLTDGLRRELPAGGTLTLSPGESVTLPPGLYHTFRALGSAALVGEVSSVNDDHHDNRFLEAVGRFPTIDEDVSPTRLLVGDYGHLVGRP